MTKQNNHNNEIENYLYQAWYIDTNIASCINELNAIRLKAYSAPTANYSDIVVMGGVDGLGVYEYLIFSGSKENLGDKTKSDLFEAIVGAIYLDGGYFPARKFILAHGNLSSEEEVQNHKGALQEWLQERGENPPQYHSTKSGKDHAPRFQCVVTAFGETAEGEGKTIKEAEAYAAFRLLWELKKKYGEHSPTKKRKK